MTARQQQVVEVIGPTVTVSFNLKDRDDRDSLVPISSHYPGRFLNHIYETERFNDSICYELMSQVVSHHRHASVRFMRVREAWLRSEDEPIAKAQELIVGAEVQVMKTSKSRAFDVV